MIVLAGGDLVLPDRILGNASIIIDGDRITAIDERAAVAPSGSAVLDVTGCYVVPGFVDVHVHGVEGRDTLDEGAPVREIAARLPRYGVTAFCPTTVACPPDELARFVAQVAAIRQAPSPQAARVLPAHLESNFISSDYRGAQPAACLRLPVSEAMTGEAADAAGDVFSARDIFAVIDAGRSDIGIITLAPELPGAIDLVRRLVSAGHRVSLGHSGADFDTAVAAIEAGATHATHLFNRMAAIGHRAPGIAAAVLAHADVTAELICDGYHVHPAMCRVAIAAKGVHGIMAITDGTAGSGLPVGSPARLGGRPIRVGAAAAFLDDGTLAGSTLTMDLAFRNLVTVFGASLVDAAIMCSTTPSRQLGRGGRGAIELDAFADLVVLDRQFSVRHTLIDGRPVYAAP